MGMKISEALHSVTNEWEEILSMVLVPSKHLLHTRAILEDISNAQNEYGHGPIELFYLDNAPQERSHYESCIPSLKTNVVPVSISARPHLPNASIPSSYTIKVLTNTKQMAEELIPLIELSNLRTSANPVIIACDAEWVVGKAIALFQICFENAILLMRIHRARPPTELKIIIESDSILKVGRQINGDINKVLRDKFNVTQPKPIATMDLASVCQCRCLTEDGRTSLASLTAVVLGLNLPKEEQLSDWEATNLSAAQIHYAALDVYVSQQIYIRAVEIDIWNAESLKAGSAVRIVCSARHVAVGEFQGWVEEHDAPKKNTKFAYIQVKSILVPKSKPCMPFQAKTLDEFGALPFSLVINANRLSGPTPSPIPQQINHCNPYVSTRAYQSLNSDIIVEEEMTANSLGIHL